MTERIVEQLPFWDHLSSDERALVSERSFIRTFSANQLISNTDNSCTGIVFIVRGGIRTSLISEEGKEITLFRVGSGECCVTTASCVIKQISFATLVTTTEESTLLIVPASQEISPEGDLATERACGYLAYLR